MGLFTYKCCDSEWKVIVRGTESVLCPTCNQQAQKVFNPPHVPVIYEIKDKYRGVRVRQDLNRQAADRSHQHTVKYKIGDIVADHGIDAAKKAGYLNEKGSKKTAFDEK